MESSSNDHATDQESKANNSTAEAAHPEVDTTPVKKRGMFLPTGLFSGKQKERATPETRSPENTEASSPLLTAPKLDPLTIPATATPEARPPELATSNAAGPAASASSGHTAEISSPPQGVTSKTLGSKLALTTAPGPEASAIKPQPPTPMDNATIDRTSAQLTLGFEIRSLQLTPHFKIGSVQLKTLSNVVSLHLIATRQAENPFAVAISFQIEHVEIDGSARLKSLLLKPLGEARETAVPSPKLQTSSVALLSGNEVAPISVTTSEQVSTVVQVFGTFAITGIDFTPTFGVGSIRLVPVSQVVLVRVTPSVLPTARDLPPSFEIAEVQIDDASQIVGARLVPSVADKF